MEKLYKTYTDIKNTIEKRVDEFKSIVQTKDIDKIHKELFFCILTPQSKAKICWETVEFLNSKNLINKGSFKNISKALNRVRFNNNKARYIIRLRDNLQNGLKLTETILDKNISQEEKREWLVKNIKGLGYKEASHFLRNPEITYKIKIFGF